jgi:glycosyl transferase, family 25
LSAPKAFILHLERATGRKVAVDALRAALPIESEILPAVEGRLLSPEAVGEAYRRSVVTPRYPFTLRLPEIGAFLSHRSAWRRIVDDRLDFAVIFEDDAATEPAVFAGVLSFLQAERRTWDYVLMPAAGLEPSGESLAKAGGYTLLKPHAPPLRAIGQFVSRSAAERLLETTAAFDRPVDTFLQMSWITGVPLLAVTPTPVRDVSRETGGTTVQRLSKGLIERAAHEVLRPVYRVQVMARHRREMARPDWRPTVKPRIPSTG